MSEANQNRLGNPGDDSDDDDDDDDDEEENEAFQRLMLHNINERRLADNRPLPVENVPDLALPANLLFRRSRIDLPQDTLHRIRAAIARRETVGDEDRDENRQVANIVANGLARFHEEMQQQAVQAGRPREFHLASAANRLLHYIRYTLHRRRLMGVYATQTAIDSGCTRFVARQMSYRAATLLRFQAIMLQAANAEHLFDLNPRFHEVLSPEEFMRVLQTGRNRPFRSIMARNLHLTDAPWAGMHNTNPFEEDDIVDTVFSPEPPEDIRRVMPVNTAVSVAIQVSAPDIIDLDRIGEGGSSRELVSAHSSFDVIELYPPARLGAINPTPESQPTTPRFYDALSSYDTIPPVRGGHSQRSPLPGVSTALPRAGGSPAGSSATPSTPLMATPSSSRFALSSHSSQSSPTSTYAGPRRPVATPTIVASNQSLGLRETNDVGELVNELVDEVIIRVLRTISEMNIGAFMVIRTSSNILNSTELTGMQERPSLHDFSQNVEATDLREASSSAGESSRKAQPGGSQGHHQEAEHLRDQSASSSSLGEYELTVSDDGGECPNAEEVEKTRQPCTEEYCEEHNNPCTSWACREHAESNIKYQTTEAELVPGPSGIQHRGKQQEEELEGLRSPPVSIQVEETDPIPGTSRESLPSCSKSHRGECSKNNGKNNNSTGLRKSAGKSSNSRVHLGESVSTSESSTSTKETESEHSQIHLGSSSSNHPSRLTFRSIVIPTLLVGPTLIAEEDMGTSVDLTSLDEIGAVSVARQRSSRNNEQGRRRSRHTMHSSKSNLK